MPVTIRAGRSRGFTTIELVVASLLVIVGLALASSLLLRSQIASRRVTAAFADPLPRFASEVLRSDLERGRVVGVWRPGWREEELVIGTPSGVLRWFVEGGSLLRETRSGGPPSEPRIMLRDVRGWRWRRLGSAVDAEVRLLARDATGAVLLDARRTWLAEPEIRVESLRVAKRGEGGW